MSELFKSHLNKFIEIDNEEFADLIQYFQIHTIPKKENLLIEGQACKYNYFVLGGILRKFFINAKGVEQTTEFAIEKWWMTESYSFRNQTPSEFYIQTVEPTTLLSIHREAEAKMLTNHPSMERYFHQVYQIAFAATQRRIKFLYDLSREDLYHFFLKSQPAFLQRVPQYLIASYLNITPEYLSEIRRKSIS